MPAAHDPEHERFVRQALADFERPLLAYAKRLLGGDLEAARDVVQETFLRLCREGRENLTDGLRAWLFTVCRNRILDVLRKEGRMKTMDDENARRLASTAPPPTERIEQQDSLRHVLEVLGTLPEKQREVLRLKFQHGLSYAEIARVTDQKSGTVGWLIHEGIRELRARLEPERLRGVEA